MLNPVLNVAEAFMVLVSCLPVALKNVISLHFAFLTILAIVSLAFRAK